MTKEAAIQEAVRRLASQFEAERIVMFGSQARGTSDVRSDVDLLVVCRFRGRRRDVMVAMDRALSGLPFARDIVVVTPEEFTRGRDLPGSVIRPAVAEGRLLYEHRAA